MGLFGRLKGGRAAAFPAPTAAPAQVAAVAHLFGGNEDLEVVGEASYQVALWAISGGSEGDRIRHKITAVLVPEPKNPYDPNAIAIHIEGKLVGYLARDVASHYLPGLLALMTRCGSYVALQGVIVGGGYYDDGPGRLGVWLEHDPHDFGLTPSGSANRSGRTAVLPAHVGAMRTGFSEAWLTDVEDDSYDLSWFNALPDADVPAIVMLRKLLATPSDPIDRHFQFAELVVCLVIG